MQQQGCGIQLLLPEGPQRAQLLVAELLIACAAVAGAGVRLHAGEAKRVLKENVSMPLLMANLFTGILRPAKAGRAGVGRGGGGRGGGVGMRLCRARTSWPFNQPETSW